ncbi:hypothetical protein J4P90_21835 [Bacillus sp. SY8(2021)]|uniref:Uncharacterized protein n=1 Tax=Bacillus arachidis TaxID=2819290 RepID=A0ABS3P3N7_9BACI|nr:hypothetical protein [Bacillus arachidis]
MKQNRGYRFAVETTWGGHIELLDQVVYHVELRNMRKYITRKEDDRFEQYDKRGINARAIRKAWHYRVQIRVSKATRYEIYGEEDFAR